MNNESQISDSFNKTHIPILVGITGHRDLENEQELMNQIKEVLLGICERYQASPIVLLTPLAEGADRVAAKVVIDIKKINKLKIDYMVILPMDEEEYTGTFLNKSSIDEYRILKDRAIGCYKVPISNSLEIDKIQDIEKKHSKLYANMGTYIALNTQIMIAAWNGAEEETVNNCRLNYENAKLNKYPTERCVSDAARCPYFEIKHGGTYHILRIRFFGVEDEYRGDESFLINREFGPVYWIRTKRKSSKYLCEGDSVVGPAYPDFPVDYSKYTANSSDIQSTNVCNKRVRERFLNHHGCADSNKKTRTYEEILLKLNEYNRDINEMYPTLIGDMGKSYKELMTFKNIEKAEVLSVNKQERSLLKHYAIADVLSLHYQKKRKKDVVFLILLAFFGLLSFNLYAGPISSSWFILLYALIYLLGSLLYILKIKNDRYHERYIDYRGIAEGIRVQFFWNLVGIKTRVADRYLTKQKSSISWIRVAISNASLLDNSSEKENNHNKEIIYNIDMTYKLWLLNQHNYYNRKWPQKDKTELSQKKAEKVLFITGLAVAIALAALDTYEFIATGTCGRDKMFLPFSNNSDYESTHKWFVFIVGFLPIIIASFRVYTEMLAYSKLARNFKWMRMVYNIGLHEFNRLKNNHGFDVEIFTTKSRKLFYDIGNEALLENGEWIGIFEERVPEMPK